MFIVRMVDPKTSDALAASSTAPAVALPAGVSHAYEAPSLVEVGTLRDLTAAGSFIDPT